MRASPDVQIVIAGQPYTLRFSAKALAAMQDHWQLDSLDAVGRKLGGLESGNASLTDFTAILWAALRTHHPDVTLDHALDMFDEMGVDGLLTTLGNALGGSTVEGGGDDAPANPPRRGRSRASKSSAGNSASIPM